MGTKYVGPSEKGDTKVYLVSVGDLLIDFLNGIIEAYDKNRSALQEGGLSKKRVKDMANDFIPTALGAFHISDNADGTYTALDAHHRFATLMEMNLQNKLTAEIKAQVVALYVVHAADAKKTYQRLNASKGHSGREKIMNSDFPFGAYLAEWTEKTGVKIGGNFAQSLFDIAFTRESAPEFFLEETWKARGTVGVLLDKAETAKDLALSSTTIALIIKALKVYGALCHQVRADKNYSTYAERAISNPGFFQAIVADQLSNGKALGGFSFRTLKVLARKITSSPEKVLEYSKTISRRNTKVLKDSQLAKLLG